MKKLIQIEKNRVVKQLTLKQRLYRLGRNPANDISFNTPKISGLHAVLTADGDTYAVEDNNSTNHVFVNGTQVNFFHNSCRPCCHCHRKCKELQSQPKISKKFKK